MNKLILSKYFIFISVLTFATVFVFMVSKSYDNLIGPIQQAKANNLTKPIDANLDVSTLKLIESRLDIKYTASASSYGSASASQP